jgi:hypothetical protein
MQSVIETLVDNPITPRLKTPRNALMAELVDALVSGTSE